MSSDGPTDFYDYTYSNLVMMIGGQILLVVIIIFIVCFGTEMAENKLKILLKRISAAPTASSKS
jgi:hypothetical protein